MADLKAIILEKPGVGLLLLLAVPVTLGLILALVIHFLRPGGEPVGQIDLAAPDTCATVELSAGDTLLFSGSVTINTRHLPSHTAEQRSREGFKALANSKLTIRVAPPNGAEQVVTCNFLGGSMTSDIDTDAYEQTENDIFNDCRAPVSASGPHVVCADVVWSPKVILRQATLQLRRKPGD
jgi:hypothetical protein